MGVDTEYGRSRSQSINGTGVLADLFRARGHTVRSALRLTEELDEWADVIVRFAPYPGPPEKKEGAWLQDWLGKKDDRRLIYVPQDFDAEAEYWSEVLDHLPKGAGAEASDRERAEKLRNSARTWVADLPKKPKEVAGPSEWFAVSTPKSSPAPVVCKTLGGPWAKDVDPARAAITRHEVLKIDAETVLLEGDGEPLAMEYTWLNQNQALVIANGSFLLNEPLLNPARRPLALRVVHWIGDRPRNVAFVEGRHLLNGPEQQPTLWQLAGRIPAFLWVLVQMGVLGLAASLAWAGALGRPLPEPSSGEDRPAAHPEALGALLAKSGQAAEARALLDTYRRWRAGPGQRPPAS